MQCCRIRSDHNEDHSAAIINEWLNHTRHDYNDVDFLVDESEIGAVWLVLMLVACLFFLLCHYYLCIFVSSFSYALKLV